MEARKGLVRLAVVGLTVLGTGCHHWAHWSHWHHHHHHGPWCYEPGHDEPAPEGPAEDVVPPAAEEGRPGAGVSRAAGG